MARHKYEILNKASEIIGLDDILIPGTVEHNVVMNNFSEMLDDLGVDPEMIAYDKFS